MEVAEHLIGGIKRLKKEGKERVKADDYDSLLNHSAKLEDSDFMPFGKHKDVKMENVPPGYLNYLWNEGMCRETGPVADYIRDALPILRLEYTSDNWHDELAGD